MQYINESISPALLSHLKPFVGAIYLMAGNARAKLMAMGKMYEPGEFNMFIPITKVHMASDAAPTVDEESSPRVFVSDVPAFVGNYLTANIYCIEPAAPTLDPLTDLLACIYNAMKINDSAMTITTMQGFLLLATLLSEREQKLVSSPEPMEIKPYEL